MTQSTASTPGVFRTAAKRKTHKFILGALWTILAIAPLLYGLPYYTSPFAERPYLSAHDLLSPAGLVGQGLGIVGSLMMLFGVFSYMARKRWAVLQRFGKLRSWLTFHIFLCTLGPFLVLLHTSFKFGNIASISFWSMATVVASGIFGRYVYIHIPKSANGQFFSPQDLKRAQDNLIRQVASMTGMPQDEIEALVDRVGPTQGIFEALFKTIHFELQTRKHRQWFDHTLATEGVEADIRSQAVPLMLQNAQLQLRRRVSTPFVRAFGYWHVLHIPLALVMLAALLIHIGVAIAFGYTWVF